MKKQCLLLIQSHHEMTLWKVWYLITVLKLSGSDEIRAHIVDANGVFQPLYGHAKAPVEAPLGFRARLLS